MIEIGEYFWVLMKLEDIFSIFFKNVLPLISNFVSQDVDPTFINFYDYVGWGI